MIKRIRQRCGSKVSKRMQHFFHLQVIQGEQLSCSLQGAKGAQQFCGLQGMHRVGLTAVNRH